jgi:hypothetical protein
MSIEGHPSRLWVQQPKIRPSAVFIDDKLGFSLTHRASFGTIYEAANTRETSSIPVKKTEQTSIAAG